MSSQTSLYVPYQCIGQVTDGLPFCINRLGEEIFLTVSLENCFQIFRFNKLTSCLVSKSIEGKISCVQTSGHLTYLAVGSDIIIFSRNRPVKTYSSHTFPLKGLLLVGKYLISYDEKNHIKVFDVGERRCIGEMSLLEHSRILCITHPPTYINKFLVAFENGKLQLWNFNSKKLIHEFSAHLQYLESKERRMKDWNEDTDESASEQSTYHIACVEQSPVCDVVALGFRNGSIVLLNMKVDRVLFSFQQEGGEVTSLSFRTDNAAERYPYLVSSSQDGRIHVWNLGGNRVEIAEGKTTSERRLQSTIEEAHMKRVTKVAFIHGEPIMVSSGEDNAIKVWIFDSADGSARLLRSREGHSGTPSRIRFYGGITNISMRNNADATSCEMISVGTDGTVRLFNTALENQNREMSQKPILKRLQKMRRHERLPECISFDFCETRQRDWGNMVTIHENHTNVYVWRYTHRVITELILRHPEWQNSQRNHYVDRKSFASAVSLSACGNFCVVGYKGGMIYQYNLQSGMIRGSYPSEIQSNAVASTIKKKRKISGNVYHETLKIADTEVTTSFAVIQDDPRNASLVPINGFHTDEVTGLFIDTMNGVMISSGLDGRLIFWDFSAFRALFVTELDSPIMKLEGFRDANFVAIMTSDRVIRVYDTNTRRLCRRFENGHSREITDMAFSPDGRRMLSSSVDGTLRVWDMPTGKCVSWLQFASSITSIAISLSGEYLCVSFADKEGIYMYIDRSLYETIHVWREPTEPTSVIMSHVKVDRSVGKEDHEASMEDEVHDELKEKNTENEEDMQVTVSHLKGEIADSESAIVGHEVIPKLNEDTQKLLVTKSSLPRGYWATLFNLEAIKERNRPVEPPKAPPAAPFFLPTVVREGSTPSFPTPQEYEKLISTHKEEKLHPREDISEEKKGKRVKALEVQSVNRETETIEGVEDLTAFAEGMTSVWNDSVNDSIQWFVDTKPEAASDSPNDLESQKEEMKKDSKSAQKNLRANSRILSRKTALPRCRLVAFLRQEFPTELFQDDEERFTAYLQSALDKPNKQFTDKLFADISNRYKTHKNALNSFKVLIYMKELTPSAVDLELRALCTHEEDVEGIVLLRYFLLWLSHSIGRGDSFELLQAYLHRLLVIYSEMFSSCRHLSPDLQNVLLSHKACSEDFRDLVQKNLCLLKMSANIPLTT